MRVHIIQNIYNSKPLFVLCNETPLPSPVVLASVVRAPRTMCPHSHTHTCVHNPHHHQQRRHRPTLATHILGSACCTQSSVDEDTSAAASRLPTQTQTPGTRGHAYIINNMHDVHTHTPTRTHTHKFAHNSWVLCLAAYASVCVCS